MPKKFGNLFFWHIGIKWKLKIKRDRKPKSTVLCSLYIVHFPAKDNTRSLSLESQSGRLRLLQTLSVSVCACVSCYWWQHSLCSFHQINARATRFCDTTHWVNPRCACFTTLVLCARLCIKSTLTLQAQLRVG